MAQEKQCPSCRVPLQFSAMNVWNSDGTITQARNPDHRLFFYNADGFDRLFTNVGELIGTSIERIVIDSKRKATLDYLHTLISGPPGMLLRTFLRRKAYGRIATTGALLGYGHYELKDFKRGEYLKVHGDNVYCPSLISADLIAIFNYIERLPADLRIEDEAGGKLITVERGRQFEKELTSRLAYRKIPRKSGNWRCEAWETWPASRWARAG